jgi:hypothetical protein
MLNPITYTERVVGDFLRYQLTTYPFADRGLHDRMRRLLNLEETRATPLLKGPYVSLSRSSARCSVAPAACDAIGLVLPCPAGACEPASGSVKAADAATVQSAHARAVRIR